MGSSSGLDRPRGAGAAAICVVDTLTTIGWSFFASVTKSGGFLDGAAPLFAKNPSASSVFLPEQPQVQYLLLKQRESDYGIAHNFPS
jgi:hypothetical protein